MSLQGEIFGIRFDKFTDLLVLKAVEFSHMTDLAK